MHIETGKSRGKPCIIKQLLFKGAETLFSSTKKVFPEWQLTLSLLKDRITTWSELEIKWNKDCGGEKRRC